MTRPIRVDTCAPGWPWLRQTPGRTGRWGTLAFHVDDGLFDCEAWAIFESIDAPQTARCARDRTVFITGEPTGIGQYHPDFLAQFAYVVSGRADLTHPRQIRLQPAHPWFIERDLDFLLDSPPPVKSLSTCLLISDKAFTEGHRRRLEFLSKLRSSIPEIDVYGRGIRPFERKWDTLVPYRYTIVLENSDEEDFLTEKLPDAWLAYCYPIYAGSVNAERYASPTAFDRIDLADADHAIAQIYKRISHPSFYNEALPALMASRRDYLLNRQFFANLANVIEIVIGLSRTPSEAVTIRPNAEFLAGGAKRADAILAPNTPEANGTEGSAQPDMKRGLLHHLRSRMNAYRDKIRLE